MKLPVIKTIVESYNFDQLKGAEESLLNEEQPAISISGDDEGEQLTHVMAAIYIKELMETESLPYNSALRQYTSRVRTSIS
jgi:hypothetical protein